MAQAAFVGIGAYTTALLTTHGWPFWPTFALAGVACFAVGWVLGYPALRVQHHYLAFVTLAFNTLVFLIFRNEEWLTDGIYGITNIPRPSVFGWRGGPAARLLFLLPRASGAHLVRDLVADPLALGPRLRRAARESDPRALARRRYAPLHADGVRHRRGPWRSCRLALCAAGAVHRPDAVRAGALAQSAADGGGRRRPAISSGRSSARSSPCCCPNGCASRRVTT